MGLDLTLRTYPGSSPIRDTAHVALLAEFRGLLHPSIRWSTEVPLPVLGDPRAWDAFLQGADWRYGVEAETAPNDSQALTRRLQLKARDGDVDGVLLVLRSTAQTRRFIASGALPLGAVFPIDGRAALRRLASGNDPGGNALIVLPPRRCRGSRGGRGGRLSPQATSDVPDG